MCPDLTSIQRLAGVECSVESGQMARVPHSRGHQRKREESSEAESLGICSNKALEQDLHCSRTHRASPEGT